MNKNSGINTLPRFVYLNSYAWLLLFIGAGVAFVPCYEVSVWLVAPQAVAVFFCLKGAIGILRGWSDKQRKYRVLMERNTPQLRPETFTEFMQAPCGKLLVRVVLHDLACPEAYASLLPLQEPLRVRLRQSCRRQKTTLYINKNYQP